MGPPIKKASGVLSRCTQGAGDLGSFRRAQRRRRWQPQALSQAHELHHEPHASRRGHKWGSPVCRSSPHNPEPLWRFLASIPSGVAMPLHRGVCQELSRPVAMSRTSENASSARGQLWVFILPTGERTWTRCPRGGRRSTGRHLEEGGDEDRDWHESG